MLTPRTVVLNFKKTNKVQKYQIQVQLFFVNLMYGLSLMLSYGDYSGQSEYSFYFEVKGAGVSLGFTDNPRSHRSNLYKWFQARDKSSME